MRHCSPQVVFEDYLVIGYNYRMTDIQAAIGRKQLERLPQLVLVAAFWPNGMPSCWEILTNWVYPFEPEWARSNWQSYCVRLPDRVDQKAVMQRPSRSMGSRRGRGIMCSHREPCYSDEKSHHDLRQSELAQDRSILLPIYTQMTEDDQVRIANALRRELSPP